MDCTFSLSSRRHSQSILLCDRVLNALHNIKNNNICGFSELYGPNDGRLSEKLVPTSADRGCRVVISEDPYGCNLGFLDRWVYCIIRQKPWRTCINLNASRNLSRILHTTISQQLLTEPHHWPQSWPRSSVNVVLIFYSISCHLGDLFSSEFCSVYFKRRRWNLACTSQMH
jgi:hypothetical protein